jgi:hypothetical protein
VARHTSRRYSVSRQALTNISFATHSATLTVVTQLIHILHFTMKNVFHKPPQKKKNPEQSNLENEGTGNAPPLLPTVFPLDGAPPHFSRRVHVGAFLDREFPGEKLSIVLCVSFH